MPRDEQRLQLYLLVLSLCFVLGAGAVVVVPAFCLSRRLFFLSKKLHFTDYFYRLWSVCWRAGEDFLIVVSIGRLDLHLHKHLQ